MKYKFINIKNVKKKLSILLSKNDRLYVCRVGRELTIIYLYICIKMISFIIICNIIQTKINYSLFLLNISCN